MALSNGEFKNRIHNLVGWASGYKGSNYNDSGMDNAQKQEYEQRKDMLDREDKNKQTNTVDNYSPEFVGFIFIIIAILCGINLFIEWRKSYLEKYYATHYTVPAYYKKHKVYSVPPKIRQKNKVLVVLGGNNIYRKPNNDNSGIVAEGKYDCLYDDFSKYLHECEDPNYYYVDFRQNKYVWKNEENYLGGFIRKNFLAYEEVDSQEYNKFWGPNGKMVKSKK